MWTTQSIGMVDAALLAVLVVSVLVGLWRGGVYEVMAVLGWVVAYVAAQAFAPVVAPDLPLFAPDSALRIGLALALVFFVVLLAWSLQAWPLRKLADATPLTLADRMLGGAFGLFRGIFLLLVAATLVAFTPAQQAPAWQRSRGAHWLGVMLGGINPMLPVAVARYLPE